MALLKQTKNLVKKNPHLLLIYSYLYNLFGVNKTKIKGRNNKIEKCSSLFKKTYIKVYGDDNIIILGKKCKLENCRINIYGKSNKVIIGNEVYLKDTELYIEDDKNEIIIGNKTTVQGKTHIACIEGRKIKIGDDCMFSTDVVFRTGDSHSIINKIGNRINNSKDIIVGDHVWFGNKTIVNKGVHIANNSIVGTGAVVTKQFQQIGIILAGNPAKVIKDDINWLRERI